MLNCPPSDKAPFDRGSLLHYHGDVGWHWDEAAGRTTPREIEWRDIKRVYEMTLIHEGNRRGRSAAYMIWVDAPTGHTFPVFMADIATLIKHGIQPGGIVTGKWRVRKRGQNYGMALIP